MKFPAHPCKVKKFIATFAKNSSEMTAERDIAGFALPFAAGTAMTTSLAGCVPIPPATFIILIAFCMLTLMHPIHKTLTSKTLWCLIIIAALSCGALAGVTGKMTVCFTDYAYSDLTGVARSFNRNIKTVIHALPFDDNCSAAVITALITGDRTYLPVEIADSFRRSGASHILALSGLHLGIIYGLMKAVLSISGRRKSIRISSSIFIILACGFYTLATGAGPSITRAFLFILLGETASLKGRFRSTGTILCAALILQIVINPDSMRSVSFQLSYAAMAGIAWIYPELKNFWKEEARGSTQKVLKRIWNSASLSIACQITTGPIAWYYFGTFPKYFLLTNLIALPLTGVIIPASLILIMLEAAGTCPSSGTAAVGFLIKCLNDSLEIISSF